MSECTIHQITFGPREPTEPRLAVHVLDDTRPNVADFACPLCGERLFIYYRTVPLTRKPPTDPTDKDA